MSNAMTIEQVLHLMHTTRLPAPLDVSAHLLRSQVGVEPGHVFRLDMKRIPPFFKGAHVDAEAVVVYINPEDRAALDDMSDTQVLEAVEAITQAQERQVCEAFMRPAERMTIGEAEFALACYIANPRRTDVMQHTRNGLDTKLSDACLIVLEELAKLRRTAEK